MADLDWLAEIGPRFFTRISSGLNHLLRVFLNQRAAFSTSLKDIRGQGYEIASGLSFELREIGGAPVSIYAKIKLLMICFNRPLSQKPDTASMLVAIFRSLDFKRAPFKSTNSSINSVI